MTVDAPFSQPDPVDSGHVVPAEVALRPRYHRLALICAMLTLLAGLGWGTAWLLETRTRGQFQSRCDQAKREGLWAELRVAADEWSAWDPADSRPRWLAAEAAQALLVTGQVKSLRLARRKFMKLHGTVFRVLRTMQDAYYKSDDRRERFVSLCHDIDVQKLTFDAYMNKRLVSARPLAHLKIGLKNLAHLTGLVRPEWT